MESFSKAASVHGTRGNADTITFREKPRKSCCRRRLLTTERSGTIKTPRSYSFGRTSFNDDEWAGFEGAAGNSTRVVGVTIKHADDFRLYRRDGDLPVLRGLGLVRDEKYGFLATNGFIPRLQTYYGSEVPVPLSITINRGEADIQTVMADILALTKLNYNSCRHSDGLPVTLKFADAVGEILVSGPQKQQDPPLPFRHYI